MYGLIQSIFDGMIGESLMEIWLDNNFNDWEHSEWNVYTDNIRQFRKQLNQTYILQTLNKYHISIKNNTILFNTILQLTLPRQNRMKLTDFQKIIQT